MCRYRATVESTDQQGKSMQFVTEVHDELFTIVERMQGRLPLSEDETKSFAVGLKLFGETILRHRAHSLFGGMEGPMGEFMQSLKAGLRKAWTSPRIPTRSYGSLARFNGSWLITPASN